MDATQENGDGLSILALPVQVDQRPVTRLDVFGRFKLKLVKQLPANLADFTLQDLVTTPLRFKLVVVLAFGYFELALVCNEHEHVANRFYGHFGS